MAMSFVERVKNEIHSNASIPVKTGGGVNIMDTTYNLLAQMKITSLKQQKVEVSC